MAACHGKQLSLCVPVLCVIPKRFFFVEDYWTKPPVSSRHAEGFGFGHPSLGTRRARSPAGGESGKGAMLTRASHALCAYPGGIDGEATTHVGAPWRHWRHARATTGNGQEQSEGEGEGEEGDKKQARASTGK